MIHTFERRRGFQIAGCMALAALATIFLLQGLFMWPAAGAPAVGWICVGVAALFYTLLIPIIRETFTPGPMLTIGPEGILYRPFSPQIIPWPEISEIKLVRAVRRYRDAHDDPPSESLAFGAGGRRPPKTPADDPAKMGIVFNVRDPSRYRARGGFGNAMTSFGAGIAGGIQISMVRATTPEILAAINPHWGGDIPIVEPANPFGATFGGK